jgi:hypothetical protein
MNAYREGFEAQALAMFDRLELLGLVDKKDRFWLEHPTNPLGVRAVAQMLGTAAERLPG